MTPMRMLPLLHIILNNTLITPSGIFVAPLREFLKYIRCSILLEGCNETMHIGVSELYNESSITLLGDIVKRASTTAMKDRHGCGERKIIQQSFP